ncbi:unnamed protein product [Prorocentrum cordatum]|uniref:Fibronectin type-III domain-containing protein n=1 Tax=Prorocentrum cordatum TaxID=2364126 RepID=A0ABN9TY59_9DINO|nr:unnamed protein product [Polarella glacialis]
MLMLVRGPDCHASSRQNDAPGPYNSHVIVASWACDLFPGWRILVDDADDEDDIYDETVIYDTTIMEYTFTSGIVTGHRYRVKIQLCSVVGCSAESGVAPAVGELVAASSPSAPGPVYVESSSNTQLTVSWMFSGSNGGSVISGWDVYVSADGDNWGLSPISISNVYTTSTTIDCADYNAEQQYLWIRVAAVNIAGVGLLSDALAARCSDAPATPPAPTLVGSSMTHITIQWSAPNSTELYNALHTGTIVQFDDGAGGPFVSVQLSDTLQEQYTLTGLLPGMTYRFRIQTLSDVGESIASNVLSVVAASTPDAPAITVASSSNSEIVYNLALTASTGGTAITQWYLYFADDGVSYPVSPTVELDTSNSSYTFDCTAFNGASVSQQYVWLKVSAVNSVGEGALAAAVKQRCAEGPGKPNAPTLVSSTANSITVSFATNGLNGAYLTGFKLYVDNGAGGPWSIETLADTTQRTFTKYGLSPGLSYRFKVQVISEVGESDISDSVSLFAAATASPPSIYVTSSSNTVIDLAWTPSFDGGTPVTGWLVFGSVDGTTWDSTAPIYTITSGSTTSQSVDCTDNTFWGASYTKSYLYFRVSAVNGAGTGAASNSYRWRCSEVPGAPAAPAKVSSTRSSITISYAPLELNSAVLTGYIIMYDDGYNGDFQEVPITATSQLEYTAAGLTAGLTYRFKAKVTTEVGESPESGELSLVAGANAEAPGAVYYVTSQNNNEMTVAWDFTGSNGGVTITNWYLYMSSSYADSSWPIATVPGAILDVGTMQYTLDCTSVTTSVGGIDLSQNSVYFRVAAVTAVGVGSYSPISKLFCADLPDAPTVYDNGGTESSVSFTWEEGGLNGAELKGYRVYMNDGLGGALVHVASIMDTSQRYYTATGLPSNREYHVQVTVVSGVGEGAASSVFPARSCGLPSKPDPPTRQASTADTVTLEWAPPADNGCPLTGYRIYQDTDEDGVADGADIYPGVGDEDDPFANGLDASVLEFIKGGLTTAQRYGFQVRAYNARGSTYSDWAYIRAAGEPVAMSQPSQDVASSSSTSIGLAWSVPDMQGGTCVGFKVFRDDGSGTDVSTVADATCGSERKPAPQSCVISGLKYGEIYTIRMLAINDVGEGPYSDTVEYRAATYPSQITNLTNTAASYDDVSLTFTWDAPADNGAAVFNYVGEVYKMDDGTTTTWDAGGDAGNPQTSLTVVLQDPQVSNMFAGLQYKFRVAAINEAGTGAWSDWSDTTVDAPRGYIMDPPNVPTAFARKDPSAAVTNEVSISWTGPTNTGEAGGDAPGNVQYEVYSGTTTSNMRRFA